MSRQNVAVVEKAIGAFLRREIEPVVEVSDPESEWYPFTAQVDGGEPYRGHEGLKRWLANVDATFEEFDATVDEIRDKDDVVVALGSLRSRFRSGVRLDGEIGWVFRFRDGLVVWGRAYQSHAEALEAAGIEGEAIVRENVGIMREWIDAFNRDGHEEAIQLLHPDIEWTTTSAYLEAGTYHGHEGVRQWMRRATAGWDHLRIEPTRLIGAAEQVVVPMRVTARATQTGTPGAVTFSVLAELQGDMIIRVRNYTDQTEALEAAGLPK
jgi:ketosteroid isomerase-like protein